MRVLVVEDDCRTAAFITKALQGEGAVVDAVGNGEEAIAALVHTPFDAAVIDIMLPGVDGLTVVRRVRERGVRVPVLLLSARGEVNDKVIGLDAGADDYLAKPFALEELAARLRALGRRVGENRTAILRVGNLSLDTVTRVAHRGSRSIELTQREYRLLEYLMRAAGRTCSRMMIIEKVWDYSFDPGSNVVDVYIRKLRGKIDEANEPRLFHSVRGVGYVMKESA